MEKNGGDYGVMYDFFDHIELCLSIKVDPRCESTNDFFTNAKCPSTSQFYQIGKFSDNLLRSVNVVSIISTIDDF